MNKFTMLVAHDNLIENWPIGEGHTLILRDITEIAERFDSVEQGLKPLNELRAAGYLALGSYTHEGEHGDMIETYLWWLTPKGLQHALMLRAHRAKLRERAEAAAPDKP